MLGVNSCQDTIVRIFIEDGYHGVHEILNMNRYLKGPFPLAGPDLFLLNSLSETNRRVELLVLLVIKERIFITYNIDFSLIFCYYFTCGDVLY